MAIIEIFWDDLTPKKQAEIMDLLGDNGNYDVMPIATIEVEEAEEECHEDCTTCPQRQFGCINDEHAYLEDEDGDFDSHEAGYSSEYRDYADSALTDALHEQDDYDEMQSMADHIDGVPVAEADDEESI